MWYELMGKIIGKMLAVMVMVCVMLCGCDSGNATETDTETAGETGKTLSDTGSQQVPVIVMEDEDNTITTPPETDGRDTEEIDQEDTGEEHGALNEPELTPESSFYAEEISDGLFARMQGNSFPQECTTPRDDLLYLHLLYKDTDGNTHEGEMVCNRLIADKLIDIFRQLYEADYPIEKMVLIDDYGGDDDASMSDNNTSCFNFRVVSGTSKLSKHAMGLAVDLNPRYNPYIHKVNGTEVVEPANGADYADRSGDFPYKIDKDDLAYRLFIEAGFTWGGSWKNSKDYQHFQYR